MSFITPSITNAGAIVNGDNATPTFMNGNLDPLKTFTEAIAGYTRVSTSSATYNITSNTEVVLFMDASGGARVVNLPDAATQKQSITIKKQDATFNVITINTFGSDTIESNTTYALLPITTLYTLSLPDQSVTLVRNGTQWRVESSHINNRVMFKVRMNNNQVMNPNSALYTPIQFNNKSTNGAYDLSNNFDVSTYTFTAPVNGIYNFSGIIRETGAGGTSNHFVSIVLYVNGSAVEWASQNGVNSSSIVGDIYYTLAETKLMLEAGDEVTLYYRLGTSATGTIVGSVLSSVWSGELVYLT